MTLVFRSFGARRYCEVQAKGSRQSKTVRPMRAATARRISIAKAASSLFSDSGATPSEAPEDDPELELCVFGKRLKRKRSELIEAFDLGGLPDERIIKLAQKEMVAKRSSAMSDREGAGGK